MRSLSVWQVWIDGVGWKPASPQSAAFVASRDPGRVMLGDVRVPFSIPFGVMPKHAPIGSTPRRLASAVAALKRQRDRVPLFAEHLEQEQPTAEQRVDGFIRSTLEGIADMRNHEAAARREAKAALALLDEERQAWIKIRLLWWFGPRRASCLTYLMKAEGGAA